MRLDEVAALVGGQLSGADPKAPVGGVEVDSRRVRAGDLFAALPGVRTDGHEHAGAAIAAGAVAVLAARELAGVPYLLVDDPLAAVQALARVTFARDQPLTFGITGSSGKTSTKDLLAHLLAAAGPVLAPVGSYNNEVGLPLTALRRRPGLGSAVFEYSARGVGHIAFLCGLVRPHVAVELNVGTAHLGEFGSREQIAKAKAELVEAVGGYRDRPPLVVLNAADPLVAAMRERVPAGAQVITFGAGADYRAEQLDVDDAGRPSFRLVAPQGSAMVRLALRGEHAVDNALAAAAAALSAGVASDVERVADRLGSAGPVSHWRMEVAERADGVTVVNDAYNANPESMRAALRTLAAMSRGGRRRTWAVLGPMGELGECSRPAHQDLGRQVAELAIDRLVAIGPPAGSIHTGAVLAGSWRGESVQVTDVDAAVVLLREQLEPGDVVLVKASRAAGLERVAQALLDQPELLAQPELLDQPELP